MSDYINIAIPSKPKMVSETENEGTYEISNLYPGYGNTLGNALRRVLLSSIPGVAIAIVRINDVLHEFSTIDGVKEDVLTIVINMKNIRVKANIDVFPQKIVLKKKGKGLVYAGDFEVPSQIEIVNKDLVIAEITDDKAELSIEADVYKGIGFRAREDFSDESLPASSIVVDTTFSPVKRSSYEVHNMRVGDRTDFNRLSIFIETDGTIAPNEALDRALRTMIKQFEAMLGFQTESNEQMEKMEKEAEDSMKTITIRDLDLSANIVTALEKGGITTVIDILKKGTKGIQDIPGIGVKAVGEIVARLEDRGIVLKDN